MLHTCKIFIFTTIVVFFLGCGEESNYTTTPENNYINTPQILQSTFDGIVVDGYIKDADICFDTNMDGTCTQEEQTTTTDTNGKYSLNMLDQNITLVQIMSSGGEDTSTDKSIHEKLIHILDYNLLDENDTIIISPITDLVAHSFNNSRNKSLEDLSDAKNTISAMLGLTIEQLDQDPMLNIDIFALSQEIQHTKLLLETLCIKYIPEVDLNTIQDEIKKQLIELDFDIEKILISIEIRLSFNAFENEKDFIIAQADELNRALNSLAQDTSLDIENLNRLQKSLALKQDKAYILLRNADENSILNVIDLDITGESLTQSIFNQENAIYDENACISRDAYNELVNQAFYIGLVTDTLNGISIKSNYDFDADFEKSEVTIYYPSISQTLSDDTIIVFEEDINYYFTFDAAWVDNVEKTIYIKTPKDTQGLFNCYRYELNSIQYSDITKTKVFSYSELN